jgi:peptidoglycan/xylan/chitin deacetylase (PgdA/CDA1 family)
MRRLAAAALAALAAATGAAPAGAADRDTPVPILLYHRVAERAPGKKPGLHVPPRLFARQVAALEREGYTAVTLAQVRRHWDGGPALPDRPVVLSFDDGFVDQYVHAARILRRRGWPGVLYLQVGRLGERGAITRRQVARMLRDGWELGAHSLSHADLTEVDPEQLEAEVGGSRFALQRMFPGAPVESFAYPYGRFDAAVVAAVRAAGFADATTTRRGAASPADGRYRLDRIVVNKNFSPARLLRAVGATSAGL